MARGKKRRAFQGSCAYARALFCPGSFLMFITGLSARARVCADIEVSFIIIILELSSGVHEVSLIARIAECTRVG